jgi:hypothetical protein
MEWSFLSLIMSLESKSFKKPMMKSSSKSPSNLSSLNKEKWILIFKNLEAVNLLA